MFDETTRITSLNGLAELERAAFLAGEHQLSAAYIQLDEMSRTTDRQERRIEDLEVQMKSAIYIVGRLFEAIEGLEPEVFYSPVVWKSLMQMAAALRKKCEAEMPNGLF